MVPKHYENKNKIIRAIWNHNWLTNSSSLDPLMYSKSLIINSRDDGYMELV
jgi:hypothetical protein